MGAAVNHRAFRSAPGKLARQAGLTLVELMISIAIAMTVMSGVVQVLVVSKANFVTERELSGLQENARFALKFMSDEIRMAGFSGCSEAPQYIANSVEGSVGSWYLENIGLQGYEYDGGILLFPADFQADVAENTDALVIRRGEDTGLRVTSHAGTILTLNKAHAYKPGQVMVLASAKCDQTAIFQSSGPANVANTAVTMEHDAGGGGISPDNCEANLTGSYNCNAGAPLAFVYPSGSRVMELRSEAYYVGASEADATVPALFRERMLLDTATSTIYTAAEELVQGVENMQILYGLDNVGNNGVADIYARADNDPLLNTLGVPDPAKWKKVVTVRLVLRMRSVNPVYTESVAYPVFEGVVGTDGSDRFMRQTVATTIQIRNS